MPSTALLLLVLLPVVSTTDLLIVGAGTSGCTLAARLCTALPRASILLLERGVPRDRNTEFLVRSPRTVGDTWSTSAAEAIVTNPDPGLNNRANTLFTGASLGGGSAINGLQWVFPRRLPSGTSEGAARRAFKQVGFRKPLKELSPIYTDNYIRAAKRVGFALGKDPFKAFDRAIWQNRIAADRKGFRIDACTTYVDAVACPNLKVEQSATVTRLKMKGKTVTGVEYVRNNKTEGVQARETILAAGPYGSPKLLQLSGIGPRKVLRKLGIVPHVELPVGERIQNRAQVAFASEYSGVPLEPINDPSLLTEEMREKFLRGEGGVYATGSAATNMQLREAYTTTLFIGFVPEDVGRKLMTSFCFPNAKSVGWMRVRSRDPFDVMEVQQNLMSDRRDVRAAIKCLKSVRDVHRSLGESFNVTIVQPMEITEEYVRNTATSAFHVVGGCARGDVVDRRWRVKGVGGVRVVDSSSIANAPLSAGTMSVTYTLAEEAAEKIAIEYKKQFGAK